MTNPNCRFCAAPLTETFVDLGKTPLANSYLKKEDLHKPEPSYPLHARVCKGCFLVQVESVVPPEHIFGDYAYFSSYSSSWVEHARKFTEESIKKFALDKNSKVIEIASNDGYLLKHFVERKIPCLGIEPAANVAEVAVKAGVPTEVKFFGVKTAEDLLERGWQADLLIANNVLAHVPDLNDFVSGLSKLVKPSGVISIEFPHLLRLIEDVQFDTIYHEHYCYFSLVALEKIFEAHGLKIFDSEELATHGGSLRISAHKIGGNKREETKDLQNVRKKENEAGLDKIAGYQGFSIRVKEVCAGLLKFLNEQKTAGKKVAGYGAAAKGNTLLNVCKIGPELIDFVVDKNPHKQSLYLPGSKIPIYSPEEIFKRKPDYLVILPWNLADEISGQMKEIKNYGGKFVTAIPRIKIF